MTTREPSEPPLQTTLVAVNGRVSKSPSVPTAIAVELT